MMKRPQKLFHKRAHPETKKCTNFWNVQKRCNSRASFQTGATLQLSSHQSNVLKRSESGAGDLQRHSKKVSRKSARNDKMFHKFVELWETGWARLWNKMLDRPIMM